MTTLILTSPAGATEVWRPTTLRELGSGEKVLEALIARNPDLLNLASHGVFYQDARSFQQIEMVTPDGRRVRPDVLMLTDAGHIVVVEVKRNGNAEFGRSVIAQIADYAATFASMTEAELCQVIPNSAPYHSLSEVAADLFPKVRDPRALGTAYRDRFRDGDLTLVVACDVAPMGARPWIESVANQSALAFKLLLVEVTPWACATRPGEIIYVPKTTVETEIVSRTAVTIRASAQGVTVNVSVDSAEAIDANLEQARSRANRPLEALLVPAQRLALGTEQLWEELVETTRQAVGANWSKVYAAVAWDATEPSAYLRGKRIPGYHDGRLGVDLLPYWKPSIFVGVLVDPRDHKTTHSDPALGPDFVVIVSVDRKPGPSGVDGDAFLESPEFRQLRARLVREDTDWDVHDHLGVVQRPNRWHPIHLRRPLVRLFDGCTTPSERRQAWFDAARAGVDLILRGGELERLVKRLSTGGSDEAEHITASAGELPHGPRNPELDLQEHR